MLKLNENPKYSSYKERQAISRIACVTCLN